MEKDLLAHSLDECRGRLMAERECTKRMELEFSGLREQLAAVTVKLAERTQALDQEKLLTEALRRESGRREEQLRKQLQAETEALRDERASERREALVENEARKLTTRKGNKLVKDVEIGTEVRRDAVCSACALRQQAQTRLLSEAKSHKASGQLGPARRALEDDVDGLTNLLISAASPGHAKPRRLSSSSGAFKFGHTPERATPPDQVVEWVPLEVRRQEAADDACLKQDGPRILKEDDQDGGQLVRLIEDVLKMRAFLEG